MQIVHYPFPPPGDAPATIERESYPVPALTSEQACSRVASGPAAGLLALAMAHGWAGIVTHATGQMPHAAYGTPTAVKDSEAVRLTRGLERAVAVRRGSSWESLWTWSDVQFFTRRATLGEFKAALT